MGLQKQTVVRVLAAQIHQHAALHGALRLAAEIGKLPEQDLLRRAGEAGGAVRSQQPLGDLHRVFHVLLHLFHACSSFVFDRFHYSMRPRFWQSRICSPESSVEPPRG